MTISQDNYKLRYEKERDVIIERSREYRRRKSQPGFVNLRELRLVHRQAQIDALTDVELAYIAGIIDGEGTISVMRNASAYRRGTTPVQYFGRIHVVNTCVEMMNWLNQKIGGAQMKTRKTKEHYKDVYLLLVNGCACAMLCKRLLPYLIIKRRQAELVVALYSVGFKRDAYRVTPEEQARRHQIWEQYRVSY